ncbi:hypothetical protein CFC21_096503 [Triticum aestivum]|uniref:VQ domain-containing protein n=3 Tax=Triticum TaxID=4564 RepID=A0A9R0Z6T7_TRITD|nr:hypothetical protein CFC21_096503 [Triticum aestivum]VAI71438.1 unnamed protein product [Triticum turgidum subsp. durum]
MESNGNGNNSNNAKVGNGCGGGAAEAPRRPHWRHRDRSATAVYLVHPDQFRAVVQQLTGAEAPPPVHGHSGGNGGADRGAAMAVEATKGRSGAGSSVEQRTLAQLHHDCLAWADEC